MEVHAHHTHTPRKKFKHYLFEFFMLFLAVVLAFFAENIRERAVEKHREKQYIGLLQRDLQIDFDNIESLLQSNSIQLSNFDSLLAGLKNKRFSLRANHLYRYFTTTTYIYLFTPTDRTIQQLKSGAGLRLISNLPASDSITAYYEQVKQVVSQGEIFLRYFDEYHRDAFNVFEYGQLDSMYYQPDQLDSIATNLTLMTKDPQLLKRLYSKLFVLRFITVSYMETLTDLRQKLINCQSYLHQKYG
jgi:hypothetical protein